MTTYTKPADFEARLAVIRERALSDSAFADALRMISVSHARYAHGMLAALGLARLGEDFASADLTCAKLSEQMPVDPIPEGASFIEQLSAAPSAARAAAIERLKAERFRRDEIWGLVSQVAAAGETPNYDGAPC